MINQLASVITSPVAAFEQIKVKPTILFPFLLILGLSLLTQIVAINLVDFDYLIDTMVQQIMEQRNLPESEARQAVQMMTPTIMTISGVAGVLIAVPLIYAAYAGYLLLMGKFINESLTYRHYFSLMSWSSITAIFTAIATMLAIVFSSDRQFAQTEMNPLTLQNLFFRGAESVNPLMANIDLASLWGLGLLLIGFKVITGTSWVKSAIIVFMPLALIGGLVFLIAS